MPGTDSLPSLDRAGPLGPGDALPSGLDAAPSVAILRVLRVTLHVGFAALLGVAVLRLLLTGGAEPLRYVWAGTALVLAAVYLTGTILEKRFAAGGTGLNPRRYGVQWLGIITALWFFLLAGSADFAWLAFPLFFLHLHLLSRRIALLTIALMTAAVVAAQWAASGFPVPLWQSSWDRCSVRRSPSLPDLPTSPSTARRRTNAAQPMNSAAPGRSCQLPSTTPGSWPSASGWPAKSTTHSPRGSRASCWWPAQEKIALGRRLHHRCRTFRVGRADRLGEPGRGPEFRPWAVLPAAAGNLADREPAPALREF